MTSNGKNFLKKFKKQVDHDFDGSSRQIEFQQPCISETPACVAR